MIVLEFKTVFEKSMMRLEGPFKVLKKPKVKPYKSEHISKQIFGDLYKAGIFPKFSELLGKILNGEDLSGVEKMALSYYSLAIASSRDTEGKSINLSNSQRIRQLIRQLSDAVADLLGADIDYGLGIHKNAYAQAKSVKKLSPEEMPVDPETGKIVKPEYKKPRPELIDSSMDDFFIREYGDLYFPYGFREGPNSPDVNHNITKYDNLVDQAYKEFENAVRELEQTDYSRFLKVLDNAVDEYYSKFSGGIRYFVDLMSNVRGFIPVDVLFFSSFRNLPYVLCISNGFSNGTGTVKVVYGGFICNDSTLGKQSFYDEPVVISNDLPVGGFDVEARFDNVFVYTKDEYGMQYTYIRDMLTSSAFEGLFDKIADYIANVSGNLRKHSTDFNILVGNVFSNLVRVDSGVYEYVGYIEVPIVFHEFQVSKVADAFQVDGTIKLRISPDANEHFAVEVADYVVLSRDSGVLAIASETDTNLKYSESDSAFVLDNKRGVSTLDEAIENINDGSSTILQDDF